MVPMAIDPLRFWMPDEQADSGVPRTDLEALEARWRVGLPASLQACMLVQDGGRVRYTDLEILDLAAVRPPDPGWWGAIDNADQVDRERVFDVGFGPFSTLLWMAPGALNSGAVGMVEQTESTRTLGEPIGFDAFFDQAMRVEQEPPFSWSETEILEVTLASELELVDTRPHYSSDPQSVRQVLTRSSEHNLVLYSHVQKGFQSSDEYRERASISAPIGLTHIRSDYGVYCMDMGPVTERLWAARMFDGTWKADPYAGTTTSCLFAATREELRNIQLALMPGANGPPFD